MLIKRELWIANIFLSSIYDRNWKRMYHVARFHITTRWIELSFSLKRLKLLSWVVPNTQGILLRMDALALRRQWSKSPLRTASSRGEESVRHGQKCIPSRCTGEGSFAPRGNPRYSNQFLAPYLPMDDRQSRFGEIDRWLRSPGLSL